MPRKTKTVKIQLYRGYGRMSLPLEALDHLNVEDDTRVKLSYWRKGPHRIFLESDAIIVEVVRE